MKAPPTPAVAPDLEYMEEGAFVRDVLGRDPPFGEWLRYVLGERRGEAPYELLRAWRAAFCVPEAAPYETCGLVEAKTPSGAVSGFYLRTPRGRVLLFAHAEARRVTIYHPTELAPVVWDGWRDTGAWPWPRSYVFVPDWYRRIPKDIQKMIIRTHTEINGTSATLALLRAPVCKNWMAFWESAYGDDRRLTRLKDAYGQCLVGTRSALAASLRLALGALHLFESEKTARVFLKAMEHMNPGVVMSLHTRRGARGEDVIVGLVFKHHCGTWKLLDQPARLWQVVFTPGRLADWANDTRVCTCAAASAK